MKTSRTQIVTKQKKPTLAAFIFCLATLNSTRIKTKPRIFLVEDDIDDQDLLEDAMRVINPSVMLVSFMYGRKFIEALEKTDAVDLPQLIILDYNIPELNGLDLLLYLKENDRYRAITKVVWSTSSSQQFRNDCLALGAKDYIVKPSNFAEMNVLAQTFLSYCQMKNTQ